MWCYFGFRDLPGTFQAALGAHFDGVSTAPGGAASPLRRLGSRSHCLPALPDETSGVGDMNGRCFDFQDRPRMFQTALVAHFDCLSSAPGGAASNRHRLC